MEQSTACIVEKSKWLSAQREGQRKERMEPAPYTGSQASK